MKALGIKSWAFLEKHKEFDRGMRMELEFAGGGTKRCARKDGAGDALEGRYFGANRK